MTNQSNYDWGKPKPEPTTPAGAGCSWVRCGKCSGTGLYVQAVVNGQPYSATGLDCWGCNGRGWKIRKARRVRCPECGNLVHKLADGTLEPHHGPLYQKGDYMDSDPCPNGGS